MTLLNHISTSLKTFADATSRSLTAPLGGQRKPRFVAFNSSAIEAAAYDRRHCALWVRFTSGRTYEYGCVERTVFRQLRRADSAGAYFNREIRPGGYPYREVPPS